MSFDYVLIGFVIAVGAAVLFFELSMFRSVYGEEARQKKHLKDRLDGMRKAHQVQTDAGILRDGVNASGGRAGDWLPGVRGLQKLIDQSGHDTSVSALLSMSTLFAAVAGIVAFVFTREIIVAVVAAAAAASLPFLNVTAKRNQRQNAFDEQLSEAIDVITRALRAGHTLDSSLLVVSEELENPIAEEFAISHAELSYGVPHRVVFERMLERVPSRHLKAFVTSVLIQRETGGNLAEILKNISGVIRGGYRFQRKLKTLSAEGRMSAMVLAAVPLVLGTMMFVLHPDLMSVLFKTPRGHTLLWISSGSYIVGLVWIRKLITIDI